MSRKAKGKPRRWLAASNLLKAHLAFHIVFVFGYWFSLAASLSFSETGAFPNHAAVLSEMLTNHLGLLIVLVIHMAVFVASRWWGKRQHHVAKEQYVSMDDHMTAEQKLELLLDEVAELREAIHEHSAVENLNHREPASRPLRVQSHADEDAMIRLRDFQAAQTEQRS